MKIWNYDARQPQLISPILLSSPCRNLRFILSNNPWKTVANPAYWEGSINSSPIVKLSCILSLWFYISMLVEFHQWSNKRAISLYFKKLLKISSRFSWAGGSVYLTAPADGKINICCTNEYQLLYGELILVFS